MIKIVKDSNGKKFKVRISLGNYFYRTRQIWWSISNKFIKIIWFGFLTRNMKYNLIDCVLDEMEIDLNNQEINIKKLNIKQYNQVSDFLIEFNEEVIYW